MERHLDAGASTRLTALQRDPNIIDPLMIVTKKNYWQTLSKLDSHYEDEEVRTIRNMAMGKIEIYHVLRESADSWPQRNRLDLDFESKVQGEIDALMKIGQIGNDSGFRESRLALMEIFLHQLRGSEMLIIARRRGATPNPRTREWARALWYESLALELTGKDEDALRLRSSLLELDDPSLREFGDSGQMGMKRLSCRYFIMAEKKEDEALQHWNSRYISDEAIHRRDELLDAAAKFGATRSRRE